MQLDKGVMKSSLIVLLVFSLSLLYFLFLDGIIRASPGPGSSTEAFPVEYDDDYGHDHLSDVQTNNQTTGTTFTRGCTASGTATCDDGFIVCNFDYECAASGTGCSASCLSLPNATITSDTCVPDYDHCQVCEPGTPRRCRQTAGCDWDGGCEYTCNTGYYNCDGDKINGCEATVPCDFAELNETTDPGDCMWVNFTNSTYGIGIPEGKTIDEFNLTIEHFESDTDITLKAFFYNWTSNAWQEMATPSFSATEANYTVDLLNTHSFNTTDETNRTRIKWCAITSGATGDKTYVDYFLITYSLPYIEVNLTNPDPGVYTESNPKIINQYSLFTVNATVTCKNGDCDTVHGTVRYNASPLNPDTPIKTTQGVTPFYIVGKSHTVNTTTATTPFDSNQRAICKDGAGNLHVAWKYDDYTIAYANSSDGVSWNVNTTIINATGYKHTPHISCDGNNITVAYEDSTNDNIIIWKSENNGKSFTQLTSPDVATGGVGTHVLVERRGQRIYIIYRDGMLTSYIRFINSTDGGNTWGPKKIAMSLKSSLRNPSMVVDGNGGPNDKIYVVASENYDDDTYFVNSTDSGVTWGSRIKIITGGGNKYDTSITFNSSNLYVVAEDGTNNDIYFTNSTDSGVTWTTDYRIDQLGATSAVALSPSVTIDEKGYPVVFWDQNDLNSNKDIVYRKYNGIEWENVAHLTNDNFGNRLANTPYKYYNDSKIHFIWKEGNAILYSYIGGAPENPKSCGYMTQGDTCQLNWTINATGDANTAYKIDVNFSSSIVTENDTDDAVVKIVVILPKIGHANGVALYYYTGERVNGNVTLIPVENPENKTNTTCVNGEWSMDFDMKSDDVQYLTFIIDDNEKIGYNYLKLDNDNPSTATLNCTTQNISLSGHSVNINSGNPINSGDIRVSILDTDYTNTTSFSGTWSIDFHPCLVSGKIYTLQILVSDNTGSRGTILQKYPAR